MSDETSIVDILAWIERGEPISAEHARRAISIAELNAKDVAAAEIERLQARVKELENEGPTFVLRSGPEVEQTSIVVGVDALVSEVKSLLWDGDDPPEDVLAILDVVGDTTNEEWIQDGGWQPHLSREFEDGWFDVWLVVPSPARALLQGEKNV